MSNFSVGLVLVLFSPIIIPLILIYIPLLCLYEMISSIGSVWRDELVQTYEAKEQSDNKEG